MECLNRAGRGGNGIVGLNRAKLRARKAVEGGKRKMTLELIILWKCDGLMPFSIFSSLQQQLFPSKIPFTLTIWITLIFFYQSASFSLLKNRSLTPLNAVSFFLFFSKTTGKPFFRGEKKDPGGRGGRKRTLDSGVFFSTQLQ